MVHLAQPSLDPIFAALGDPRRRAVIAVLSQGSRSVTELARPHGISLTGFMKHLRVLEDAGLIVRAKQGRVVRCTLAIEPISQAIDWMADCKRFWTQQLESLGRYLDEQEKPRRCQPPDRTGPRSTSRSSTPRRPRPSGARGPTRRP